MADVLRLAPTKKRGRMLAIVFSMQAFGYAAATITSIVVVKTVRHYHPTPSQVSVDQIWRWVMGLSLIPASVAVVMRFFVPESPRFTLYVLNYLFRAL
jgi:PHS family inorganic phosphate transporter-like MFS transporter